MLAVRAILAAWLVLATLVAAPVAQAAWVETRVKAHAAVVDVDEHGAALVRHELTLGVRGGPLRSFEIPGIDPDAELTSEPSTATPIVRFGVPTPIPLTLARQDDGTLKIEIEREKGLFTGSYVFRFEYRTSLLARDRIRRRGAAAEVEWVGPRFPDGVDVAKMVFRLPEASSPPVLPQGEPDDQAVGSVFLSSLRHVNGKVEVELVRPHVARGEPAVWRVLTEPKSFAGLPAPPAPPELMRAARTVAVEHSSERLAWASGAFGLALLYALLVLVKWRAVTLQARALHAVPRGFVTLPLGLRAALSGTLLASAAVLFLLGDQPSVSALLLLLACALAAQRTPRALPSPRGPGRWFALTEADCAVAAPGAAGAAWLDAGTLRGGGLFGGLLAALCVGAWLIVPRSPFHAVSLLLGSSALFAIFGTGRARQLPAHRVHAPRPLLFQLRQRLTAHGLKVVPWARIPDGQREPDELRLLVRVKAALEGLSGIELGVEAIPGSAGYFLQPFALIRAREGSAAHVALGGTLRFQRGRSADERVAILRPALPTRFALERLVLELCAQLSTDTGSRTSSKKTAGASSLTAKLGVASPAHAT